MVKYKEATVTLPRTDRYPEVFRDIEKMVTESGLSASNGNFGKASVITVGAVEGQDTSNLTGMRKIQITYSIKGDISKVLSFIDKLENYDRIAELNSFNHSGENCSIVFSFYDSGEGGVEEYDFNFESKKEKRVYFNRDCSSLSSFYSCNVSYNRNSYKCYKHGIYKQENL